MVDEGLRMSTSRAYLRPAHNRPNLFVKINSRVTGLVLNKLNNRVQGVKYVDQYGEHMVRARKEVILSAGVVGSAHLLLVSGIGPAEELLRAGVTVFQDLPVGRNLQHHVSVSIAATVNASEEAHYLTMDAVSEFLATRTGPLASTGLTQTTGFLTTSYSVDGVSSIFLAIWSGQLYDYMSNNSRAVIDCIDIRTAASTIWCDYNRKLIRQKFVDAV